MTQAPCLEVLFILAAAGIILLIGSIIFPGRTYRSIFTLGKQGFGNYQVNADFTTITADNGQSWKIVYEKKASTQFPGKIRHISTDNIADFPILTHDILVTSMDFADPTKVRTSVADHHFQWVTLTNVQPRGSINLLHTIPKNEEIYQLLLSIMPEDIVTISGWEIIRITAYQPAGTKGQWWQDPGCNTLLVDYVSPTADQ